MVSQQHDSSNIFCPCDNFFASLENSIVISPFSPFGFQVMDEINVNGLPGHSGVCQNVAVILL